MLRKPRLWRWFGLWLAAWSLCAAAAAQPVAVLLDASEGASVKSGGALARATLLHRLAAQDELQLGPRARVVLLVLTSGDEYVLEGPAVARVESGAPVAVSGNAATRRSVAPGREVRVRPEKLAQGGLVLRSWRAPPPHPAVAPEVVEQRRPPAGAPLAERVAFALWLEEVDALAEAKAAWRALAAERPGEPALAERAR